MGILFNKDIKISDTKKDLMKEWVVQTDYEQRD